MCNAVYRALNILLMIKTQCVNNSPHCNINRLCDSCTI